MRILVTGSSGLIGSAVVRFLIAGGQNVVRLVRSRPPAGEAEVYWDPAEGRIDLARLEGLDAAIHLAGETTSGRWTAEKKARIRDSRVKGTQLLCQSLAQLKEPPKVLVSASAVGYYGDRGDEWLDEGSLPGSSFLAEVCQQWEAATEPAVQRGIRVINLRMGVVLSPAGGALAKMLLPFRMGVGGILGSGRQYMSWIDIDDLVGAISNALTNDSLRGPVNATAPGPITNREFTETLGRVLRRPTLLRVPAFAVRLAFGEMVDELLLASARVKPIRLLASGYAFRYPEIESALRHVLGK